MSFNDLTNLSTFIVSILIFISIYYYFNNKFDGRKRERREKIKKKERREVNSVECHSFIHYLNTSLETHLVSLLDLLLYPKPFNNDAPSPIKYMLLKKAEISRLSVENEIYKS